MRFSDLLAYGARRLELAGVTEFELDARLLLEHCSGKSRTELFLDGAVEVDGLVEDHYSELLRRREKREPVAYILGSQEFWSLDFRVTPDVLIPRPETEFLIEQVLRRTETANFTRAAILDLCCGSGAIGLVLAKETGRRVICSDYSQKALEIARQNRDRMGLTEKVSLLQGDLFDCFQPVRPFSLIVSNPPYIGQMELQCKLEPEVADFEPRLALDGGPDGLDCIRRISSQLPQMLLPGGELFMEIGASQGARVLELLQGGLSCCSDFQLAETDLVKDYSGRDRVVYARLQS